METEGVVRGGAPHEGDAAGRTLLSTPVRIVTPCPSCGSQTLFIGKGGHLTCSVIGCKAPSVEAAVDELHGKAHDMLTLVLALLRFGAHRHDPEKHEGRPGVPLCCACFQDYKPECTCGLAQAKELARKRAKERAALGPEPIPRGVIFAAEDAVPASFPPVEIGGSE